MNSPCIWRQKDDFSKWVALGGSHLGNSKMYSNSKMPNIFILVGSFPPHPIPEHWIKVSHRARSCIKLV